MITFVKTFFDAFVTFLFPRHCIGCGTDETLLCSSCAKGLTRSSFAPKGGVYVLFSYKDPLVKKIIWRPKYGRLTDTATLVATLFAEHFETLFKNLPQDTSIIVSTPSSKKSLRKRGIHQTGAIGKALSKKTGIPYLDALNTLARERQTKLKRSERLVNIKDTMSVKPQASLTDKTVIIIDDILTTGATITEARRAAEAAGAYKTLALVVAH